VSIAELIKNVLIGRCDFGDNNLSFYDPSSDILKNDARPKYFTRMICVKFVRIYNRLDDASVKRLIRIRNCITTKAVPGSLRT
jgi:hypothetical protein